MRNEEEKEGNEEEKEEKEGSEEEGKRGVGEKRRRGTRGQGAARNF